MKIFFVFLGLFFLSTEMHCCTTMLITKGATKEGSVIVGHSEDNEFGDQRVIFVQANDHPPNAKRAIFPDLQTFPRYVGTDRGSAYNVKKLPKSKPLGYIEQISHTYAYIDGNYGVMNEHQLAIGECTNSATYYYLEPSKDRIFGAGELSRIALERCTKAKEAVKVMGELAEKYGYYTIGETILLGDTEEGWVFEISCTPKGKSAIWVAKKVPDGEVFVAANQFRIQEIDPNDPDTLYSSNLFQIAKENHWWDEKDQKLFNWQKAVCPGEPNHPYYSLRRVWRVQSRLNPSLNLSPWVKNAYTKEYPFSIKPEKKLTVRDVISLYRDYYEGTEFDMTKGLAAGPYGSPDRFLGTYDDHYLPQNIKTPLKGAWERPIATYYTGYTQIIELRGNMPDAIGGVAWIGFDNVFNCCFMPLYAGLPNIPKSFQYGDPRVFSKDFAWWPFNFSSNWIRQMYDVAIGDLQKKQKELEDKVFDHQKVLEAKALALYKKNKQSAIKYLTDYCFYNAANVLKEWDALNKDLIEKYNDGYINKPNIGQPVGYPQKWLDQVGYSKGPVSYEKPEN